MTGQAPFALWRLLRVGRTVLDCALLVAYTAPLKSRPLQAAFLLEAASRQRAAAHSAEVRFSYEDRILAG